MIGQRGQMVVIEVNVSFKLREINIRNGFWPERTLDSFRPIARDTEPFWTYRKRVIATAVFCSERESTCVLRYMPFFLHRWRGGGN